MFGWNDRWIEVKRKGAVEVKPQGSEEIRKKEWTQGDEIDTRGGGIGKIVREAGKTRRI